MTAEEIIEKFTTGPEQVLGLSPQTIADGNNVPVSVLFTESNTEFTSANWQSKSKNSPALGMTLRGAVHG
jgi:dihydroorotase-like cyclic amidohydrolase